MTKIKSKYTSFCEKCKNNCLECLNTRLVKLNNPMGKKTYFMSCDWCYTGDDWFKDSFVYEEYIVCKYIWNCKNTPIFKTVTEIYMSKMVSDYDKDRVISCSRALLEFYCKFGEEPKINICTITVGGKRMNYRIYRDNTVSFNECLGSVKTSKIKKLLLRFRR